MKLRNLVHLIMALLAARVVLTATMPVFETSEARYAAISANMARSGDFMVPRYTYRNRYQSFDGKPPLQFQLSGLSCRVFGCNEFAARLPILLSTLVLLALLWKMTLVLTADRERALLAVGIAATCVPYYGLSGCCMPDGLLTPCIASAYFCHIIYLKTERRGWTLGVFAALALGMLVKGPVALALFAGPVLLDTCFNHRWRAIARYAWPGGIPLFLAIAAPWFVLRAHEDPNFLEYFFINENVKRFLVHDYGDRYGGGREYFRGMSLVWAAVVTLPWTPFGVAAVVKAVRRARNAKIWCALGLAGADDPAGVAAWGMVGITAFWCLTSRVPMGYLMPVVPLFAAYLAVKGGRHTLRRALPYAALAAVIVLSAVLFAGRWTTDRMPGADAPYRRNRYSYEFYHGTPDWVKEVK